MTFFTWQLLFAQATIPENIQEESIQPDILQNLQVNQAPRLNKMLNRHIVKNE
jgi:hypothetical protein